MQAVYQPAESQSSKSKSARQQTQPHNHHTRIAHANRTIRASLLLARLISLKSNSLHKLNLSEFNDPISRDSTNTRMLLHAAPAVREIDHEIQTHV